MFEEMVRSEVEVAINIAREAFPQARIDIPKVVFSTRMTQVGGTCEYHLDKYTIKFSLDIMQRNDISAFISQIVYHEVAHMVDRQVYGGWGHGWTFNRVMTVTFGKSEEESGRFHTFNTKPKIRRQTQKYNYKCPTCGKVIPLSSIRHKKVMTGTTRYSHKGHAHLQYLGEAISE